MSKNKWEITPEQAKAMEQEVADLMANSIEVGRRAVDLTDQPTEGYEKMGTVRVKRGSPANWLFGRHRGYVVVIEGIPQFVRKVAWFYDLENATIYAKTVAQSICETMQENPELFDE